LWLPINNLSTTLAVAVQEARARSPAVATVDQLLRQHISSWIGGSNLVCAFPAQLGNGPSAEDRRRHFIADLLYWPSADTPGVRLRDAEIAAYGTQEMITLEWQVVGLLG
jgi:hypothetical protein